MRAVLIVQPTCLLRRAIRLSCLRLPTLACPYSSTASSSSSSKQPFITTSAGHLSTSISSQYRLPRFTVSSSNVRLIEHPSDFYKELLAIISRARRRIFIASLYIGKTETDLLSHLREALNAKSELQVTIVVDSLRSTREGKYLNTSKSSSCASLLARLQADFPERVQMRLYRAPGLPSWLENLVGKRFVEGWGLQHMKIYGGDDEVMTSGANLSNDYFTNRRDRYVLLKDATFSQYMYQLLMITARYSHSIEPDPVEEGKSNNSEHSAYKLSWDEGRSLPTKIDLGSHGPKMWKSSMKREIESLTRSWHNNQNLVSSTAKKGESDHVHLIPLLQMGRLGITQETTCIPMILQAADSPNARLDFTTGYFSINPAYADIILKGQFKSDMVTASPQANGFYGSKGISGHLPAAYTWLESLFWSRLRANDRLSKVTVREWSKSGWTYHAKGIWLYPEGSAVPTISLLGSSNFGTRSAHLDTECTLLIDASESPTIQRRLKEEVDELRKDADDVVNEAMFKRPDRRVHWGVKLATLFIKRML